MKQEGMHQSLKKSSRNAKFTIKHQSTQYSKILMRWQNKGCYISVLVINTGVPLQSTIWFNKVDGIIKLIN